jgi:hypothetical protein
MSMTLIEKRTLDSTASSIDFVGIPQFYTDLFVQVSARTNGSGNTLNISFNGNTANYTNRSLQGNGSAVSSFANFNRYSAIINEVSETANTFGNSSIYIPNYTNSTNKSYSSDGVGENNATQAYHVIIAGFWGNTSAINSISFSPLAGSLVAGSTISLYGINRQQAIGKPKAIGGTITFANGYWVHTFTGSGTFYALENLIADTLVVAGGGGSGGSYGATGVYGLGGGGGGAGGYILNSSIPILSNTNNLVLVGSGGSAGTVGVNDGRGGLGQDSSFGSVIALGGGGGGLAATGNAVTAAGSIGGSGGGGSANTSGFNGVGGAGTAGQGFAGGTGAVSAFGSGGGGGGSASAGENGSTTNTTGGQGGLGTLNGISGTTQAYATGGIGGRVNGSGGVGSANTGNGANSRNIPPNSFDSTGFAGGSGIVIVRYPAV